MNPGGEPMRATVVRKAVPSDAGTIARFVRELARFEKEPLENVRMDEAAVMSHAFGEQRHFEVLIAEDGQAPVGMALFFETYSTWEARPGIWIEELYVIEDLRGQGIGSRLLESVIEVARQRDYGRVELAALDWNPATQFYEARGFREMSEWKTFRLDV